MSQSLSFLHTGSTSVPLEWVLLGMWRNEMVIREILMKKGSERYKVETAVLNKDPLQSWSCRFYTFLAFTLIKKVILFSSAWDRFGEKALLSW